ncbi:hypothetical protein BG015_002411 [Linnemannia schmuckeri]|uniref:Uncharacterized protein n=1 Tax=Linnemannia schmuckeri TaxID=64567 RepID=A0A9P5S5N0_9FUNG|nr:hypothetical protein BG015_002411 [Linnemannia schmuckeri]
MPPYHKQSSRNHHAHVQLPPINPSPSSLSPSLRTYQTNFVNDLYPLDLGENNNQPIDIHTIAAADANATIVPYQATTNALQALQVQLSVAVSTSLTANHHPRRREFFFSRLVLLIAMYLCPTFIVKPMTPLRFRMTVPIILHLIFAFAVLVLVILMLVGPMSSV